MSKTTPHDAAPSRPAPDGDLRLERAILQAKQEWERTFDSVTDCILILDPELRARRLNMSLAQRLGAHPRELLGKGLDELAGPEAAARLRLLAVAHEPPAEEMRLEAWGGDFLVAVSPYVDAEGRRQGAIVVAHDITRRKRLERQLEQSRRLEALGTLAGGIAHDFNNILGVILGYAEMMQAQLSEGQQARRVQEILRAGGRAKELVGQILTFSRQGEGRAMPMRLSPLVKEVLQHLAVTLPPGVSVRRNLPAEGDEVLADPSMIHQVLLNLCTNAGQAMRESGGTLTLSVDGLALGDHDRAAWPDLPPGPYVRLRVRDTGPGIPADIAGRIFDPFFTTKPPGEGTGMGLAVVHGIVRRLGGAVAAESPKSSGGGACLVVLLPRHMRCAAAPCEAEVPARAGRASVLLVDDEPALLSVTAEVLGGLGYAVARAGGGGEALEMLRRDPAAFDLLLTDQVMPGMSGVELAREALALRPDLPVLLCTGHAGAEDLDKAQRLGVREVLDKPVSRRELALALHRALSAAGASR